MRTYSRAEGEIPKEQLPWLKAYMKFYFVFRCGFVCVITEMIIPENFSKKNIVFFTLKTCQYKLKQNTFWDLQRFLILKLFTTRM